MKRKNNKKLALLLILVLVISVGYAALASNLKINGTSGVKASSWNVYWDNVQITNGSVPADNNNKARITDAAKTQVEFNVVLSEPGDFYEFTVDAVNNGTIDAMIASQGIVDGVYSDSSYTTAVTLPEAVSYTVTYADGKPIQEKHLLAKKNGSTPTKETYKVRIEYRNDESINPSDLDDTDKTFYFKFSVNYVQADDTAIDKNVSAIKRVKTQNEGQITPGDIIGIGETEDFYVISSNAEKTVLLAKHNLLVGFKEYAVVGHDENSEEIGKIIYYTSDNPGYGLQTVDVQEYIGGPTIYTLALSFSTENYWDDGSGTLLSPYNQNEASYDGNPYPYVYNNTMITAPDSSGECDYSEYCFNKPGYSIAYYVELYKTKLIEMGAPDSINGRLLTYEEADSAQTIEDNGTSIIFTGNQDYWLGSASSSYDIYSVYCSQQSISTRSYNYLLDSSLGLRPVIEIPTSEIK